MHIFLVLLFMTHSACAMEGSPDPLDKLSQAGTSFLNFFNEIPNTVKAVIPLLKSSSDEEESSSESSQGVTPLPVRKVIVPEVLRVASPPLRESPPKTILQQDAYVGERIPDMPILFQVTNKASVGVHLVAVLTAPFYPQRYFLGPNDCMRIGTTQNATYEQVYVEQSENNIHPALYQFRSLLLVKLLIEKDPFIAKQLCINEERH